MALHLEGHRFGDGRRDRARSHASWRDLPQPTGTAQHFAWGVLRGQPLLLTDGSTSYLYDDAGNPVEQIAADGTPLYYQHDQLASTRALTDQTGAVVATYAYDAYGQVTAHTGSADTPLRFNGQYQDPTGLYTNRRLGPINLVIGEALLAVAAGLGVAAIVVPR